MGIDREPILKHRQDGDSPLLARHRSIFTVIYIYIYMCVCIFELRVALVIDYIPISKKFDGFKFESNAFECTSREYGFSVACMVRLCRTSLAARARRRTTRYS